MADPLSTLKAKSQPPDIFGPLRPKSDLMDKTQQLINGEHQQRPVGPVKGWEPGSFLDKANQTYQRIEDAKSTQRYAGPQSSGVSPQDMQMAQAGFDQFLKWSEEKKDREPAFTHNPNHDLNMGVPDPEEDPANQPVIPSYIQDSGLIPRFGYDENGVPALPAQDEMREHTGLSQFGVFGIGEQADQPVRPGRAAPRAAQSDVDTNDYKAQYLENVKGLRNEDGTAVKSDDLKPSIQSTNDGDSDWMEPIMDWLAITKRATGARADTAADGAEWGYQVKGTDTIIPEHDFDKAVVSESKDGTRETAVYAVDGVVLPNGEVIPSEIANQAEYSRARYADEGEEADFVDPDTGESYIIETVTIPGYGEVSWDVYHNSPHIVDPAEASDSATFFDMNVTFPDGTEMPLKDYENAENFEVVQTNVDDGMWRMNKANPVAPWEDLGDFAPWFLDLAANSAPYMIPVVREATMLSNAIPAAMGYDPRTFDWRDYTFEDKEMTNAQSMGGTASAFTDAIAEKLFGFASPIKYAGKAAKYGTPARIAFGVGGESIEEAPSAAVERLFDDGIVNYGANTEIDPATGEERYVDTAAMERLGNVMPDIAEGMASGAILGGALVTPNEIARAVKDKKAGRGKALRNSDKGIDASHQETLDRLATLRKNEDQGE